MLLTTLRLSLPMNTTTTRLVLIEAHHLYSLCSLQVYQPLCERYAVLESSIS